MSSFFNTDFLKRLSINFDAALPVKTGSLEDNLLCNCPSLWIKRMSSRYSGIYKLSIPTSLSPKGLFHNTDADAPSPKIQFDTNWFGSFVIGNPLLQISTETLNTILSVDSPANASKILIFGIPPPQPLPTRSYDCIFLFKSSFSIRYVEIPGQIYPVHVLTTRAVTSLVEISAFSNDSFIALLDNSTAESVKRLILLSASSFKNTSKLSTE